MSKPGIYNIGRPATKLGYFEVRYQHDGALKTCCVVAHGFQEAVFTFRGWKLGEYSSIREVKQEHFEAWFNVSLMAANTVQELRTGAHL